MKESRLIGTDNNASLRNVKCNDDGIIVNETHLAFNTEIGNAYMLSNVVTDLATTHAEDIIFSTGTSAEIYILSADFHVSGKAHTFLFEDIAYTIIGIPKTPVCLNRTFSGSSGIVALSGSTETSSLSLTDTGDLIVEAFFPGSEKKDIAALSNVGLEIILKPHTNYLFRTLNADTGDISVSTAILFINKI